MKTTNLIKALEKSGIKIECCERWGVDYGANTKVRQSDEYFGDNGKYKIHFYDQDGFASCVLVMRMQEERDIMRDYFPGYFADSIKDAIRLMNR